MYLIGIINQCISVYADSAITSQQANLIKDTELELILELRDYSLRIIDAIAAPDKLIGSVLGQSDGQVYSHIIKAIESNPECYSKPSYVDVIKDIRNSLPN